MNTYDIVSKLRLTPVLMHADAFGQSTIDYEACKKYVNEEGVRLMLEAASEIERLRKERDEARRKLCVELLEVEGHPIGWRGLRGAEGIAQRLGWECFKENTND